MESTADTIRIHTPTEVMASACRRVSTRAKVPTSPSPWSRSGWPEPPSALHRHAAAAARAADTPGTASRCPYTGTGRPWGRHTRSRAGRPGGVGLVVSGLASADGRASPACPRASCGSRPPRASVRSAACRAVEWWHTRTTARGRRPRPRRFAKRYASSCALVRSQRCWLSVSSRFLLVLQPLSSRSSAANGGLIVGTAVAARGLHDLRHKDAPIRNVLLGWLRGHRQRVERLLGKPGSPVYRVRQAPARHAGAPRLGQSIRDGAPCDRCHDDDHPEASSRHAHGVDQNSRSLHLFFLLKRSAPARAGRSSAAAQGPVHTPRLDPLRNRVVEVGCGQTLLHRWAGWTKATCVGLRRRAAAEGESDEAHHYGLLEGHGHSLLESHSMSVSDTSGLSESPAVPRANRFIRQPPGRGPSIL